MSRAAGTQPASALTRWRRLTTANDLARSRTTQTSGSPSTTSGVSVERVFSRLKTYRKLNSLRTRRMPKVWLHVALSWLTMLVSAATESGSIRRCVPNDARVAHEPPNSDRPRPRTQLRSEPHGPPAMQWHAHTRSCRSSAAGSTNRRIRLDVQLAARGASAVDCVLVGLALGRHRLVWY